MGHSKKWPIIHLFYCPRAFFAPLFPASSIIFLAVPEAFSFKAFSVDLAVASASAATAGVSEGEAIVDFMAERGCSKLDLAASAFAGGFACKLIGRAKRESANVKIIAFFILILLFIGVEGQMLRGI